MRPGFTKVRGIGALAPVLAWVAVLSWFGPASAQEETRLLRFPHIHGDTVVFTYAGDIYTAPLSGGEARRLTSHEGMELFAKFSPDGHWIAFSGEYAGTRQVYIMPSGGGEPRQLTYYPDVGPMPPRGATTTWSWTGLPTVPESSSGPIGRPSERG